MRSSEPQMNAVKEEIAEEAKLEDIDLTTEDFDQLVEEMPDEVKDAILEEEERKASEKEERKKEKEERVEPILDTWVFTEEREKREIVPLTLEKPEPVLSEEGVEEKPADDAPLPLPKYFAELYNEFEELRRFDLKDVIYDR